MATDQQIALSRHRIPTNHAQKVSRQVVPAFLQKLYEMVNDPKNGELIRWSDAGDSFYVMDHERFAREVLGRWFKHQNFSSFVRQLNMYGFHKIPHLQQGVLRSEADTEFWNFAHANFHRGQPDLLCLIQRKKQVPQAGDDVSMEIRDATSTAPTPANLSSGQLLDIHSIVNGIAAIKRHQTTISTELNELKRSNQLLWQDSMAARAKHQKQQDTINRIVKFLAGVFGNRTGSHKEDVVESLPSRAVVPRRRTRLMIEDGRSGKVGVTEIEDEEGIMGDQFYGAVDTPVSRGSHPDLSILTKSVDVPGVSDQYPSVETPGSVPSPAPLDQVSSVDETPTYFGEYHHPQNSIDTAPSDLPASNPGAQQHSTQVVSGQPQYPQPAQQRAVTPTRSLPTNLDFDPRVQGVLNQLTPLQIQQLLASLASQPIDPMPPSEPSPPSSSQLTSYQPQFDFGQFLPMVPSPSPQPPPVEGLISFDPPNTDAASRMDNQWKAAEDIDKDVSALNSSINSLIQNLGLDPNLIDSSSHTEQEEADASVLEVPPPVRDESEAADPLTQDFDFDSFLNTFSSNDIADYSDVASTAFLDEVPSSSDGATSPITHLQQQHPSSALHKLNGIKRKSDASELVNTDTKSSSGDMSGVKSKRKKDK